MTASGRYTQHGLTISVDRNVIPLGTYVELKYPDGRTEIRRADDTGGAIKGNKIDIFMDVSTQRLYELGKHQVQLRVINM